jgi:hypothetical protein
MNTQTTASREQSYHLGTYTLGKPPDRVTVRPLVVTVAQSLVASALHTVVPDEYGKYVNVTVTDDPPLLVKHASMSPLLKA